MEEKKCKMEDDLRGGNGRRPQIKMENLKKKIEDDLKKNNGKQQQQKTTSKLNLGANLSWGWLSSLRFL
jgi:hypothetical protein